MSLECQGLSVSLAGCAGVPHLPTVLSMVRLQMMAKGGTSCDGPASRIASGLNLRTARLLPSCHGLQGS